MTQNTQLHLICGQSLGGSCENYHSEMLIMKIITVKSLITETPFSLFKTEGAMVAKSESSR